MKLPKIETLIIFVFFACVAMWAVSKCSARRSDLVREARETGSEENTEERPAKRDTAAVQQPATAQPVQRQPVNVQGPSSAPAPSAATATPATAPPAAAPGNRPALGGEAPKTTTPKSVAPAGSNAESTTLYATIDGLKVRKEAGLKGAVVATLKLYEPVTFLNKKTEWTQEISLGYEKVTDHWVKVRTKSGKEGWVFGAGVHYYKMKRQGVLD